VKIGLVAGGGSLPLEFIKQAKKKKTGIVIFEIMGEGGAKLRKCGCRVYPVKLAGLSRILKLLKKEKISNVVFLGYVRHTNIFKNIKFDIRTMKVLMRSKDLRAGSIMKESIKEFKSSGIKVLPSTYFMESILAGKGPAGRVKPSAEELKNINLGFKTAKALASLDVGQTVIVKKGVVVAAEAQEGTDACIDRGAKVAGKGFIAVKAARPKQDMRFDVPAAGIKTIRSIAKRKGRGLAIEAGKTFLINKEKLISEADRRGIFIYGI